MLLSLHVKNLALIEEEEVTFTDGLNILTGETGAGKSIIIGSINLALGARADKSIIRTGAEFALIELTFKADHERQIDKLRELGLSPEEDGIILIKRKLFPNRSICQICGETVPLRQLREVGELLIDIYGQRENQRLLRREAQRRTVDDYGGEETAPLLLRAADVWRSWRKLSDEWEKDDLDESARLRELDLLIYEADEIEAAAIREGEEEELIHEQKKLGSFRRISEAAGTAFRMTAEGGAADMVGRACRELSSVCGLDESLDQLLDQISEVDGLLSDFNRSLADYVEGLSFDPERLSMIEDRLDVIHRCSDKYGRSVSDIMEALEKRRQRIEFLEAYDARRKDLKARMDRERADLEDVCEQLTLARQKAASDFADKMKEALLDLNFLRVEFAILVEPDRDHPGPDGWDQVSMHISMNPGEPLRPLEQIASGGELSRIMLALKTVFAGRDELYSFIFDEIDTGISGQTAWKVSGKMGRLAMDHQILCITHLPQIAAMQDSHYLIEKVAGDDSTKTHIRSLTQEESDCELARLLGAGEITPAALENAREMKKTAEKEKKSRKLQ